MKNRQSYVERRRFLCGMIGGGAAALGATLAAPLGSYVGNWHSEPLPDFVVLPRAEWDLAPGRSRILKYGPLPILLLRTPEPEKVLKIFLATCTHLECIVNYEQGADHILCACHGGQFDLDGRVTAGPPPAPLKTCHHALRGDELVVALERQNLDKGLGETKS